MKNNGMPPSIQSALQTHMQHAVASAASAPAGHNQNNHPHELTVLWLTAQQTWVIAGKNTNQFETFELPIGLHKIHAPHIPQTHAPIQQPGAQTAFAHHPPTPAELETAIAIVEDCIMPLHRQLPRPSQLFLVGDTALSWVAPKPSNLPSLISLGIDEIENLFRRLAEIAEGSPVASSGLPRDTDFPAALLIIREFMHHLGYASLTCLPERP